MKELRSLEEWEACLAATEGGFAFILKHSTACPISAHALERVEQFLDAPPPHCPEFYVVKVIESRPISNEVTDDLSVQHQSPQLILIGDRRALWSTSHHQIAADAIEDAISQFVSG